MENPIKMDDLGIPLFLETPIYSWRFFLHPQLGYRAGCFLVGMAECFTPTDFYCARNTKSWTPSSGYICFVWKTFVSSFKSCSTILFWRKDQTQHVQLDALKNLPIRSSEVPRITLHQRCWQRCQRLLSQHRIMITEESSQLGDVCMFVCKDEKMWVFNLLPAATTTTAA